MRSYLEIESNRIESNQTKPNQTKPNQTKPNQTTVGFGIKKEIIKFADLRDLSLQVASSQEKRTNEY